MNRNPFPVLRSFLPCNLRYGSSQTTGMGNIYFSIKFFDVIRAAIRVPILICAETTCTLQLSSGRLGGGIMGFSCWWLVVYSLTGGHHNINLASLQLESKPKFYFSSSWLLHLFLRLYSCTRGSQAVRSKINQTPSPNTHMNIQPCLN